jgi:hypothetical protein
MSGGERLSPSEDRVQKNHGPLTAADWPRVLADPIGFWDERDACDRDAAGKKAERRKKRKAAARKRSRESKVRWEAFSFVRIAPFSTAVLAEQLESWGTWSLQPTCVVLSIFTPAREFAETVARNNLNALGNKLTVYHHNTAEYGVKHAIWFSGLRAAFLAMRASLSPNVCSAHQELFRLVAAIRALNNKIQHAGFGWHGRFISRYRAERDALLEEARIQIKDARDTCPVRKAARARDGRGS